VSSGGAPPAHIPTNSRRQTAAGSAATTFQPHPPPNTIREQVCSRLLRVNTFEPHAPTRARELARRGVDAELAHRTAYSGYGHWRCAGFSALNRAVPTLELRQHGLVSLLEEHRRLASPC
jgi:hypothetical protein